MNPENNNGLSYHNLGNFSGMVICKDGEPAALEFWDGTVKRFILQNADSSKSGELFGINKVQN